MIIYFKNIIKNNYNFIYKIFHIMPGNKNKIIMLGYPKKITPDFQSIYNKLKREHKEIKVKYIGGNTKNIVQIIKLIYNIATANTIILNDYYRHIYNLTIKKETKVIQIWHATGIFKKFGLLALGKNDSNKEEFEKNAHKSYTYVVTSSEYVRKPYSEAFGVPFENTISLGAARTDMFFDDNYRKNITDKLYEEYPYLREKKIILYAPTFRGNSQERKIFRNQMQFDKLKELKEQGYIVLIKLHPLVQEKIDISFDLKDFIYDFTRYSDINDLFFISDMLITDYSSNMFEFALLRKPILFFAYDFEKYMLERGFYDDYEQMVPGPICRTVEELVREIKYFDIEKFEYERFKYEEFITKYLGQCDGNSTERIIDLIINGK